MKRKRVHMVARKPFRYGTRRMRAGDAFEPTRAEAHVLQAVGLAADAPRQVVTTRQPPVVTMKPPTEVVLRDDPDLEAMRSEYTDLTGKKPHHLWKAPRLQAEIAAAKVEGEADAAGE